jgi:hypothetical protein
MKKKSLRSLTMLCLIAGSTVIFSCKNEEKKEDVPVPMQNEMHQPEEEQVVEAYEGEELQAEFKEEIIAKIYNSYVEIKNAFVNSDAATASREAANLAEIATDKEKIAVIAKAIAAADDVNKQREEFSKLTAAMEPLLDNALESGAIYKQYCPMAFEGKGDYWYSNSKDIFNPYFGDKMLKCGRIETTIQ